MNALLLALALAAAPKAASVWKVSVTANEKMRVEANLAGVRTVSGDAEGADFKLKLSVVSVNGDRPSLVTLEQLGRGSAKLPAMRLEEDSGAPVLTFAGDPPDRSTVILLKGHLGRIVLDDPERLAMSTCTDATAAATDRWLQTAIGRLNGTDPSVVKISALEVGCAKTKTGTKLTVSFVSDVPRGPLLVHTEPKGTINVDQVSWFTQWDFGGPVTAVSGGRVDMRAEGTFSTKLVISR